MLKELKATRFEWQGRTTSILDEVGLVSVVYGGSVLASYYVAFGDETLREAQVDAQRFDGDAGGTAGTRQGEPGLCSFRHLSALSGAGELARGRQRIACGSP